MSLLDAHREINRQTRIEATQHRKRLTLISATFSALFTLSWYMEGIIQTSPMYRELSPIVGLGFTLVQTFLAVFIFQIIIIYFVTASKYTAPKVVNGYWRVHSKLVIPEQVRRLTASGIWKYVVLHRKHDPLYQADLEAIKTDFNNKLENIKAEFDKKIENTKVENDKKIEDITRAYRIQKLATQKEHNLRIQRDRESKESFGQVAKLSYELSRAFRRIFAQEEIIKNQKRIIKELNDVIKKIKGE